MSDYERTKMYEDIIARLEKQNAALAEENLAAHLVNKEFADEVRELKQQLTEADKGIEAISQHYREWIDDLCQQLEASQKATFNIETKRLQAEKLSEERRVALSDAVNDYEQEENCCFSCGFILYKGHKPNCDYVRLTKED